MGLLGFLKTSKRNDANSTQEERAYSTGITSFFGMSNANEEEVSKIPVVQAILEIICGTIAQLPVYLYHEDREGNIEKVQEDYREYLLNNEPNDNQQAYNFKKAIVKDYLLHGNSYVYIDNDRNTVNALYNIRANQVSTKLYKKNSFKVEDADIILNGDCGQEIFKPHQLMICLKDSEDGFTSKGILHHGKELFNTIREETQYVSSIYRNGTLPNGVIQSATRLSKETIERLRESWSSLYQGSKNAGKTVILEEGLEYKPISLNPRDLLYNENKSDNISDVCRLFNFPESLINPKANKYGALEQNNIFFLQYTLSPILRAIEDSLNKSLLLESEKREGLYFSFDVSEVLRTTEKEKYDALKAGLDSGLLTVNEARWAINKKAIKDDVMKWSLGSVLYYPETGEMKIPNMGIGIEGYERAKNKGDLIKDEEIDGKNDSTSEEESK